MQEEKEYVETLARSFARKHERLHMSCRLFDLLNEIYGLDSIDACLLRATELGAHILRCDRVTLWVAERAEDGNLWTKHLHGAVHEQTVRLIEVSKDTGLVGAAFRARAPFLVSWARISNDFLESAGLFCSGHLEI